MEPCFNEGVSVCNLCSTSFYMKTHVGCGEYNSSMMSSYDTPVPCCGGDIWRWSINHAVFNCGGTLITGVSKTWCAKKQDSKYILKNQLCKCFVRNKTHWTRLLSLKDTRAVLWWETLGINRTVFVPRKLHRAPLNNTLHNAVTTTRTTAAGYFYGHT